MELIWQPPPTPDLVGGPCLERPLGTLLVRLRARMFPPPLDTVAALERFVGQRAAFVAQTSLYGYLKTRMGTKYPRYFEDPGLLGADQDRLGAAVRELRRRSRVHAAAAAGADGRLGADEQAALARHAFAAALRQALAAEDAASAPPDAEEGFAGRVRATVWAAAAAGEAAFAAAPRT